MSRPRPRPRPRPANRQANPTQSSSSSASTQILKALTQASSLTQTKSARDIELDQEDQFFIRNRNRTAKEWKKLEDIDKEREQSQPIARNPDHDDSPPASPRKRYRHRKHPDSHNSDLPEWTRQESAPIIVSDDDDDLEIVEGFSSNATNGKSHGTDQASNKRPRSRSRSLTPPPQLTVQQRQHARNVVRQALKSEPRPASPSQGLADQSVEFSEIDMDPELLSIRRDVEKKARGITPDFAGGPKAVKIKVKWRPHPLDQDGESGTWVFDMNRHDSFRTVYDDLADEAGILVDSLVLSYEGGRVFASATPHSLKIWAEAELEASEKVTFEYIREQRMHNRAIPSIQPANKDRSASIDPAEDLDSDSGIESISQEVENEDETFRLVVRSASTKDITLTVRPTTTCGAIVKAFLRRAGIPDKDSSGKSRRKSGAGGPSLMIDGEKMGPETPISEGDLEDGDQVEVVGL